MLSISWEFWQMSPLQLSVLMEDAIVLIYLKYFGVHQMKSS